MYSVSGRPVTVSVSEQYRSILRGGLAESIIENKRKTFSLTSLSGIEAYAEFRFVSETCQ